MTVNMCASENTRAWVAIRVRDNQGKVSGYTSSILGSGDSVNVGKMGHDFDVKEIGVQSVVRKPNQFFEMKFVNGGEKSWRLAGEKCSALPEGMTRWSVAGSSLRGSVH